MKKIKNFGEFAEAMEAGKQFYTENGDDIDILSGYVPYFVTIIKEGAMFIKADPVVLVEYQQQGELLYCDSASPMLYNHKQGIPSLTGRTFIEVIK